MPLDSSIPLSFEYPQFTSLAELLDQRDRRRDAALRREALTAQIQQQKAATAKEQQYSDAMAGAAPASEAPPVADAPVRAKPRTIFGAIKSHFEDKRAGREGAAADPEASAPEKTGEPDWNRAFQLDPERTLALQSNLQKLDTEKLAATKAQIEQEDMRLERQARILGAVRNEETYQQAKPLLQAEGLDTSKLSPRYNRAEIQFYLQKVMPVKDQVAQVNKIFDQELDRRRVEEQERSGLRAQGQFDVQRPGMEADAVRKAREAEFMNKDPDLLTPAERATQNRLKAQADEAATRFERTQGETERHNRRMEARPVAVSVYSGQDPNVYVNSLERGEMTVAQVPAALRAQVLAAAQAKGINIVSDSERQQMGQATKMAPVVASIAELSEKINTGQGALAKITGGAARLAAKANLDDDVAEYEALVSGFTPLVARAVGHVGVLTEQDVQSVRALFPNPTDSKSLRDRKINRLKQIIGQVQEGTRKNITEPVGGGAKADPLGIR